jgi:tripartite-type tricarboxylate transporter receptor subunit TctC
MGIVAPGGTPPAIVEKLNAAINKGLKLAETQATFNKIGFQTRPGSVPEFAARIKGDADGWASVINLTGVKVE